MSPSLTRAAPSQAFVGSRGPGSEDPEGTRPSPEGAGRALRHGSPRPARGGAIFPGGGRGHRSVPRPRRAQDPRGPGGAASACPGCGRRARPRRGAGPGAGARGDPAALAPPPRCAGAAERREPRRLCVLTPGNRDVSQGRSVPQRSEVRRRRASPPWAAGRGRRPATMECGARPGAGGFSREYKLVMLGAGGVGKSGR